MTYRKFLFMSIPRVELFKYLLMLSSNTSCIYFLFAFVDFFITFPSLKINNNFWKVIVKLPTTFLYS